MSISEQITLAWLSLKETAAQMLRANLWTPWIVLAIVQGFALVSLWWFAHPWLSWYAAPALTRIGGADLLHFPRVLTALPRLYGRADLVIGATIGALAIGMATLLFVRRFRNQPPSVGSAAATTGGHAARWIAVQLPMNGALLLVGLAFEWLGAQEIAGLRLVILAAGWVVPVLVQAWFLFVVPLVVIEDRGVLSAIRELPRVWRRGYWGAVFLGFAMLIPIVPFQLLAASGGTIVSRGDPDLVGWFTAAQIGVGLLVGFVLTGSATLYYLSGLSERDE